MAASLTVALIHNGDVKMDASGILRSGVWEDAGAVIFTVDAAGEPVAAIGNVSGFLQNVDDDNVILARRFPTQPTGENGSFELEPRDVMNFVFNGSDKLWLYNMPEQGKRSTRVSFEVA